MSCDDAAAKTPQKRGAAEGVHTSPPRAGSAGRGRVPKSGRRGGAEGGLGGGPERATKASALVAVVPERAGAPFSGPAEWVRSHESSGVPAAPTAVAPHARPDGQQPPHLAQARAASLPRAQPEPGPPARQLPARALSLSPGLHFGSASPAPALLPPHSPYFPPPAAVAAARTHLSCPSGRRRPWT